MKKMLTFLVCAILALSLAGCATNRQYTGNSTPNSPVADNRTV